MPLLRLALLLSLAAPLSAQALRVRAGAPPGGDGTSWATAFDDLQDALAAAAVQPGIDELWIAAGTYRPALADRAATFDVPDGVALLGGFDGTELVREERDPLVNVTVLDGDLNGDDQPGFVNYGDNSWHVVTASFVQSLVLDGLTVRGGSLGGGAGIRALARRVELVGVVVRENWALGNNNNGAGMLIAANELEVRASAFLDNQTTAGAGAHLVDASFPGPKTALFEGCRFERNLATSGAGFLASGIDPWSLTLIECTFLDGFATAGAGVSVSSQGVSTLLALDCVFERNAGCAGGGAYLSNATGRFERCRFHDNGQRGGCGAGAGGGGIQGIEASLTILDSTFSLNRRGSLWLDRGSDASVQRCSFSSLATQLVGAAIRVQDGSLELTDSIVWGAFDGQVSLAPGMVVGATHSNVRMGGILGGTGNLELDPLFVDPAAGDLHLQPGSPCIDAGRPVFNLPLADFERDSRVVDSDLDGTPRLDMGADEHSPYRLEIQGTPAPGSTLTIVTSGPPAAAALLLLGPPDARFFRPLGTLFVDLAQARTFTWPAPPSSVPVQVPPGLTGLFHVQAIVVSGPALVPTNHVPLQF